MFAPSGFTSAGATGPGANSTQSTPSATIVIQDLFGQLTTAPGAGAVRTVRLVAFNAARVLISCDVVGTATTCNSGSASAQRARRHPHPDEHHHRPELPGGVGGRLVGVPGDDALRRAPA